MKLRKLLLKAMSGVLLVGAIGAGYISSSASAEWNGFKATFQEGYSVVNGTNDTSKDVKHVSGFRCDAWGDGSVASWVEDPFDSENKALGFSTAVWSQGGLYLDEGPNTTAAKLVTGVEYELKLDYYGSISNLSVSYKKVNDADGKVSANTAIPGTEMKSAEIVKRDQPDYPITDDVFKQAGFGEMKAAAIAAIDEWYTLSIVFTVGDGYNTGEDSFNARINYQTANLQALNFSSRPDFNCIDNLILKPAAKPDPEPFDLEGMSATTDSNNATSAPTQTAAPTTAVPTAAATVTASAAITTGVSPTATATTEPFEELVKPKSVKLNKKKLTLKVKKSFKLKATLKPKDITKGWTALTWKSAKPKIAKVNKKGKVTAVKKGTAKITVSTKNKKSAKCTVKVKK